MTQQPLFGPSPHDALHRAEVRLLEQVDAECRGRSELVSKFWRRVNVCHDGCWNWNGAISSWGYGNFYLDGRMVRAHRHSFLLASGIDPGALCVCHRCDNRKCVRPTHLFLGTHTDNHRDMEQKQRQAFGERNGQTRLTAEKVLAIRAEYAAHGTSQYVLAERFGTTQGRVQQILAGRSWRYLTKGVPVTSPLKVRSRSNAKLTKADVVEIRRLLALGMSQVAVARRFPVNRNSIANIAHGRSWSDVEGAA